MLILFLFLLFCATIENKKEPEEVKKMKKIIPLLCLICSFILVLCACSKEDIKGDTTEYSATTEQTTTASNTAKVTFPEGFTAVQIAERLEENGVCKASDFINLINNEEYILSLGYSFTSFISGAERAFLLEGYIFPDTYEFYKNDSAENVLKKILKNTSAKLKGDYSIRAEELGYTLDEIITMASIIQEEAYTHESMKLISSVLHNRINSPDYGKLQCDVTIHYVNDYITNSPYLFGDMEKYKELYNTYKCTGLPEGPICCPGIEAIEAALYPEDTNYFYFVTDEDWNYYFNESYDKHREKCKEIGLIG